MERADGDVARTALLECDVVGNDPDNVALVFYVVSKPARESHSCYPSCSEVEGAARLPGAREVLPAICQNAQAE